MSGSGLNSQLKNLIEKWKTEFNKSKYVVLDHLVSLSRMLIKG